MCCVTTKGLVFGSIQVCRCVHGQGISPTLPRINVSECWLVVEGAVGADHLPGVRQPAPYRPCSLPPPV